MPPTPAPKTMWGVTPLRQSVRDYPILSLTAVSLKHVEAVGVIRDISEKEVGVSGIACEVGEVDTLILKGGDALAGGTLARRGHVQIVQDRRNAPRYPFRVRNHRRKRQRSKKPAGIHSCLVNSLWRAEITSGSEFISLGDTSLN